MQFALLILFTIQSAEQTEDAEFFFSPPLASSRQMWTVLAEPLYLHPCHGCAQGTDSPLPTFLSKENPGAGWRTRGFYFEVPSLVGDPGSLRALCRTTCIHSNRSHRGISSGGSGAAPKRFAHWDTPRSGGRRQLHARTRETRGHGCDGCDIPNGPGGCAWHSLKSRTLYSLFRFFVFVLLFKTYRKFPET